MASRRYLPLIIRSITTVLLIPFKVQQILINSDLHCRLLFFVCVCGWDCATLTIVKITQLCSKFPPTALLNFACDWLTLDRDISFVQLTSPTCDVISLSRANHHKQSSRLLWGGGGDLLQNWVNFIKILDCSLAHYLERRQSSLLMCFTVRSMKFYYVTIMFSRGYIDNFCFPLW